MWMDGIDNGCMVSSVEALRWFGGWDFRQLQLLDFQLLPGCFRAFRRPGAGEKVDAVVFGSTYQEW
jgi:hypothetical protein